MRAKMKVLGGIAAAGVVLAACGNDSDDAGGLVSNPTDDAEGQLVQVGETDLGEVLTRADGFTLYAFEPDDQGAPTCDDECAALWPPLVVGSAELPEGLEPEVFSVVERADGDLQLAAGGWPLYSYVVDEEPGEVNGHGVDDFGLWWVVTPEGELNQDSP